MFRVFDSNNGEELWSYQMDSTGSAPPTIFEFEKKQFILVPAYEKEGNKVYAFTRLRLQIHCINLHIRTKNYFYIFKLFCINILTITTKRTTCPRGEIGRHKGLKILALLGVPVRVGRGHHR